MRPAWASARNSRVPDSIAKPRRYRPRKRSIDQSGHAELDTEYYDDNAQSDGHRESAQKVAGCRTERIHNAATKKGVPVGNLIRLASEAESRNVSIL